MSDRIPDELLSACFDGEITPEERARVDALLASDPQARRSLEDFRKLSGLLRERPAPSAPVEFSAAVMQSIERQMLLGPVADAATLPASAPRRRARWQAGAVLMSAAALVLVAVVVGRLQGPMPEGQLAGGRGASDFDATAPAKIAIRDEVSMEAPARIAARDSRSNSERSFAPVPPAAVASPASAPVDGASSALGAAAKPSRSGVVEFNNGKTRLEFTNLKGAQVGEIVEAIEHTPGRVTVVRCTVLDRMDGVRGFQALLARNAISVDSSLEDSRKLKEQDRAPAEGQSESVAPESSGDELIGVFVEAPREQIAEVIRQFQSMEIEEVSVDEPVELEELQEQLDGESSNPTSTTEFGDIAASEKKEKDPSLLEKSGAKDSKAATADAPAPAKPQAAAKLAGEASRNSQVADKVNRANSGRALNIARQQQLNLPPRFFQMEQRSRNAIGGGVNEAPAKTGELLDSAMKPPVVAARPNVPAAEGELKPGSPAEASTLAVPGDELAADAKNQAPVQVLFVFVDKRGQAPAAPGKNAAPIKSKVRGPAAPPAKNDGAAS